MTERIFTEDELTNDFIQPDLPPPGHQRNEVLAERQDNLEQLAEEATPDTGTINPSVFDEDREIQSDIRKGYLEIDLGPAYVVKWVNFVSQHAQAVWKAKSEGWVVVKGDMVRGVDQDLVKEDNTLRVGDVICMCMRKDIHLIMERKNHERRLKQEFGVESQLHDLAAKNPKAFAVHSDSTGDNPHLDEMAKRAARRTASNHLGNRLKQGTIPGVPIR